MKLSVLLAATVIGALSAFGADLRIGIIGCDTSHATAFTETLNNPDAKGHIPGGKIVAAYKGGSPDIPQSASRVEEYAKTLREKYGVKFYDNIPELCSHVDAVLLESVDGRTHLAQVKPVIEAHKPVFVDKPVAASLEDAIEIFRLARKAGVPLFSSSSLRFAADTEAVHGGSIGKVLYAETWGPCELESHHPDLYWYGVHGIEALFTIMGPGCRTVQCGTNSEGKIEVVGAWRGGRKGVFREDKNFHGLAWGEKGEVTAGSWDRYVPLLTEIMQFFRTGKPPVKPKETLEIFAFMQAAAESKIKGGAPVKVRY